MRLCEREVISGVAEMTVRFNSHRLDEKEEGRRRLERRRQTLRD